MKYTRVDSFGECLHNSESTYASHEMRYRADYRTGKLFMMDSYTFAIVMSNTICDGYMDEKLQDAYDAGVSRLGLGF